MQDPIAKLARASEHVNLFESESKVFLNPERYTITHEFDDKARKQIWRFDSPKPFIPLRMRAIVGDALFNFRSALDHLVYQLVLANNCVPTRRNSFPISIAHKFKNNSKSSLEGISTNAITIIESSQPKPGNNWDLLFLPFLNNIDKHRYLHLCLVSVTEVTTNLTLENMLEIAGPMHFGRVENGTILCIVPTEYMEMDYRPTFDICFTESHVPDTPVLTMLRSIEAIIKNIFAELEDEVNK